MPAQSRFLAEDFFQVAILLASFLAGGFDEKLSGHFAHTVSESHGDGLGENEAVGEFEIVAHALGVDFQARQHLRQMMKRAAE